MTTDRAARLRDLHVPGKPVILPNVWDAASARAVVDAGFPVVATGSAAISRVLGHDDREATPVAEMMEVIARIARSVDVHVTADVGGPVNVFFRPGLPSFARLAELGVARVSFGDGLHRVVHDHARALFQAIAEGRDPYR
ncbi:isocitrate lyase/phosphoenolpyruvate mutase family protein [Nonomuraea lactucae]|uniref:isocitrate lyase/phosphoenolpyruvate mutase family protein n=1 Tax=Nonomuraea lactucae TaxID=2249762 RepID=UPI000DE44FDE|nr:isocitrate lyase/phosphoenolpyruvate mutase family protein [Nonomuraea lactucae]